MFPQDFKHQHITSQCHIKTVPTISMQSINVVYGDDLGMVCGRSHIALAFKTRSSKAPEHFVWGAPGPQVLSFEAMSSIKDLRFSRFRLGSNRINR